ncbi:MAG: hypothetical protein EBS89_13830, partial [Proteobacteria bacterium]|nr:hypothetical protein [Pseudomonadota bacterium]
MDWESYISVVYKAAQDGSFSIARIYRAADEATLFEVYGIGKQRNHDAGLRQKVARWKRYAHVFTPLPEGERLYHYERRYYLLRQDGSTALLADKPGVWRGSESLLARKYVDRWLNYDAKLRNYPLFLKR